MNINFATIYSAGNAWQKKVYKKMSKYLEDILEINDYGTSRNGTCYKHLLTVEQAKYNFITEAIWAATIARFGSHKAGDLNRILTNTVASQAYCFNLVIYLKQHLYLADKLFSYFLGKDVLVRHIEPEFTPNQNDLAGLERNDDESIGDQNAYSGTDSDIAVFYNYNNNQKGMLLIEFKFIEDEFSVCTSYARKKVINEVCRTERFYSDMVSCKNALCGYNKYLNWPLTTKSKAVDIHKVKFSNECPFRLGLNQLWRNMLLAEQVAHARQCDEFGFWVFSPTENYEFLWKKGETEKQFRSLLTENGNKCFKKVDLEAVLDYLQDVITTSEDIEWLDKMNAKYRI